MARLAVSCFLYYFSTAAFFPYLQLVLRNNGYSHSTVGLLLAVGEAAAIVVPLLIANFVDKSGKSRMTIVVCTVVAVLFFIPYTMVKKVWLTVIFGFLCQGVFACLSPQVESMISSYYHGDSGKYSRTRTIGTLGYVLACFFYGFSKVIQSNNNSTILRALLLTSMFSAVYCLFLPSRYDRQVVTRRIASGEIKLPEQVSKGVRPSYGTPYHKEFFIFLCGTFFLKMGNSVIERLLSSYMTEVMHFGDTFTTFIAIGCVGEIVMMLIGGRLLEKHRIQPIALVIIGGFAIIGRLMLYNFTSSVLAFTGAQLLHGLSFGSLHIASVKFITTHVPRENTAMAMSLYTCLGCSLPNMIGALAGGSVIEYFGYGTLFISYSGIVMIGISILLISYKFLTNPIAEIHNL